MECRSWCWVRYLKEMVVVKMDKVAMVGGGVDSDECGVGIDR